MVIETLCLYLRMIINETIKKNAMKTTEIRIERTRSYGHYRITGIVNGIEVSAITTDSEAFDYLNDKDNQEKHEQALSHCVMILELAYENL